MPPFPWNPGVLPLYAASHSVLALGLGFSLTEKAAWSIVLHALLPGLARLARTEAALDYARAHRILVAKGLAARWLLLGFGVALRLHSHVTVARHGCRNR